MYKALVNILKELIAALVDRKVADPEKIAAAVASKLLPVLAKTLQDELSAHLGVISFVLAADDLAAGADRVLEAMRKAEAAPNMPRLELPIEYVEPAAVEPKPAPELAAWPCGFDEPVASNGSVALPQSWQGSYLSPDEAEGFAAMLVQLAAVARSQG